MPYNGYEKQLEERINNKNITYLRDVRDLLNCGFMTPYETRHFPVGFYHVNNANGAFYQSGSRQWQKLTNESVVLAVGYDGNLYKVKPYAHPITCDLTDLRDCRRFRSEVDGLPIESEFIMRAQSFTEVMYYLRLLADSSFENSPSVCVEPFTNLIHRINIFNSDLNEKEYLILNKEKGSLKQLQQIVGDFTVPEETDETLLLECSSSVSARYLVNYFELEANRHYLEQPGKLLQMKFKLPNLLEQFKTTLELDWLSAEVFSSLKDDITKRDQVYNAQRSTLSVEERLDVLRREIGHYKPVAGFRP